jgi:hypothetical protein
VNPLARTQSAYARNVFVSTALRRLERTHVRALDDADLAQKWARSVTRDACAESADGPFDIDHLKDHLRRWLLRPRSPCRVPAPLASVGANLRFVGDVFGLSPDELAVLRTGRSARPRWSRAR